MPRGRSSDFLPVQKREVHLHRGTGGFRKRLRGRGRRKGEGRPSRGRRVVHAVYSQNYEILDMSVLGRDILNLFAVIVHRTANVVSMIGESHTYTIQQG